MWRRRSRLLTIAGKSYLHITWRVIKRAHAVLTPEKTALLQQAYATDKRVRAIYYNVAITRLADDIASYNSFIAGEEAQVLSACHDVEGLTTHEDLADSLSVGLQAYEQFRKQAAFAPLRALLDDSSSAFRATAEGMDTYRVNLLNRSCSRIGRAGVETAAPGESGAGKRVVYGGASAPNSQVAMLGGKLVGASLVMAEVVPATGSIACILVERNGRYRCRRPNAQGSPYGDQFDPGHGDPRQDVLLRATDGGYAADNRRVSAVIAEVNANLRSRIGDLKSRSEPAIGALPEWLELNGRVLEVQRSTDGQRLAEENESRNAFVSANRDLVAHATARLDEFLSSPFDAGRTRRLISEVGGSDLSLATLPDDVLVSKAPRLAGITAYDRVYGSRSSQVEQAIVRERLKAERDLPSNSQARSLASEALAAAEHFEMSRMPSGTRIAEDLLRDARATRQVALGNLDTLTLTTIDGEGHFGRVQIAGPQVPVPANTLIAVVREFDRQQTLLAARAGAVHSALQADVPAAQRRREVVGVSDDLRGSSRVLFYQGRIAEGEIALSFAWAVLDIASSWTPGISWGRDIYEAIAGKDLFSGEELPTWARTAAALGVVSLGIGSKGKATLQTIEKLARVGLDEKLIEKIYHAAKTIKNSGVLSRTQHFWKRAGSRVLGIDDVDKALDTTTHFWNVEKKSLLFVEELNETETIFRNGKKVAVAVDVEKNNIRTVYETTKNEAEFLKEIIEKGEMKGRRRFIKIPTE